MTTVQLPTKQALPTGIRKRGNSTQTTETNAPCLKFKRTTFKRNSPQKPLFFKTCKVFQTLRNSKSRTFKRDREEKREGIFFFFFFFLR